jgi:SAM-dependent methyltransferase
MSAVVAPNSYDSFISSFQSRPQCPLCESAARVTEYDKTIRGVPLRFARCLSCSLVYQDPAPSREALLWYFSSPEFIHDEQNTEDLQDTLGYYNYQAWDLSYRRTAARRLAVLKRWVPPPARLLEIGTATGSFLHEARRAGYTTRGLDVSAEFAAGAVKRYGLQIETGFVEEHPLPKQGLDVICAFGGIACWWDPLRAVRRIREALAPNGVFLMNFSDVSNPLARLAGDNYPEINHASLVIYSRRTMRQLLARAGFQVEYDRTELQCASVERIVTYWRSNLLRRVADRLGFSGRMVWLPAVGTRLVVARPREGM